VGNAVNESFTSLTQCSSQPEQHFRRDVRRMKSAAVVD
jgi:hypothetical protein